MMIREIDLHTLFLDHDAEWRRDCRRSCYQIETELSGWIGELQFKALRQYLSKVISEKDYKNKINDLTESMKMLAEASIKWRRVYNGSNS